MPVSLLLVDPDVPMSAELAARLVAAGFAVDRASDSADALGRLALGGYAALLAELDLRPLSGLDLCRAVRADARIADISVLLFSARTDEIDRVVAFEVGADDYVVKPYSAREVVLRVRARLRRVGGGAPAVPMVLRAGELEIDAGRHRALLEGRPLPLTVTEFALLSALARRRGAVVTREALLQEVWELPRGQDSRTVDTHLRRLREKLGAFGRRVETLRGVGYRLLVSDETPERHNGNGPRPVAVTNTSRG